MYDDFYVNAYKKKKKKKKAERLLPNDFRKLVQLVGFIISY